MTRERAPRLVTDVAAITRWPVPRATVLRAGWEEAKILTAPRPDPRDRARHHGFGRARGKLAGAARPRVLQQLVPGNAFTSYVELERDTLLMVRSTRRTSSSLRGTTWWFAYRRALALQRVLRLRGHERQRSSTNRDTTPVGSGRRARSGALADSQPLMSTTLRGERDRGDGDPRDHSQHVLPKGQARFNESFANFVGHRGRVRFL